MQSRSLERGAARKGAGDEDPTETTATVDGEAVSSRAGGATERPRARARPRARESEREETESRRVAWVGSVPAGAEAIPLPVPGRSVPAVLWRAVPLGGRTQQPRHGLIKWSGLARARSHPSRTVLGPGQKNGPRAGLPCSELHAHL
jgi:hypothetical protein